MEQVWRATFAGRGFVGGARLGGWIKKYTPHCPFLNGIYLNASDVI